MSTNDTEPFKDVTGNRRYWPVDVANVVNFKWLEENRDQIFAEAVYCYKNGIAIHDVPLHDAVHNQSIHIAEDPWVENIENILENRQGYVSGSQDFKITTNEIYSAMFKDESLLRLDKKIIMRIADILKKDLGFKSQRKSIGGDRYSCWVLTEEKAKDLQSKYKKEDDIRKF